MLKRFLITATVVSLIVGGIVLIKFDQFSAMGEAAQNRVQPPETVTAMRVDATQWEQYIRATATVTAVQGVKVSAETSGRVTRINFKSGDKVATGDILIQLDTASEDAQLASALAAAELARTNLARAQTLSKQELASQDLLDTAATKVKETAAQVQNVRAAIAKKTVRAPFSGRLGIRQVNLGEVLREGDEIVSLQTLDPVYVDFSVPQQELKQVNPGLPVRVSVDAAPGQLFTGRVMTTNPYIDPVTRSIRVRAEVKNPDQILRPGMFTLVNVILPNPLGVLPVAETAIAYATFGDSVFVIDKQKDSQSGNTERVLRQQFVQLGQRRGDFVDVIDGLKAGETVVTSGVFKLRSGMKVVIDNTLAPKPSLDPHPPES